MSGGIVVLDGAMGTELEARGARMDGAVWGALANLTEADLVREIHEDHIRAGADVVTTNTFMSGSGPMTRAGVGDRFEQGILNAIAAARAAIQRAAERPISVAGSIGATPWGAPEIDPASELSEGDQLRAGYARQANLLREGGVDVIALEMVTDIRLGLAALDGAMASGLPVWLGLSMRVPGHDPSSYDSLPDIEPRGRELAHACLRDGLDAVNVMHTDVSDVDLVLALVRPLWAGVLGVYPHHGLWTRPHWTFVDVPDEDLVALAQGWIDQGVGMLGGCCGLRSHHIAALRTLADTQLGSVGPLSPGS